MTCTARITIDSETVSPSRAIAAAARSAPLLVVSHRAFNDLCAELGSEEAAARHLCRVATNTGRPIAANLPTGPDTSTTVFISPKGWGRERLAGWVAGKRDELEELFGEATIREESA